jgi:hypothetical protein
MRILRVLGSRRLLCGCLVGVYETYSGFVVEIVDATGTACQDDRHGEGALVRSHGRSASECERSQNRRQKSESVSDSALGRGRLDERGYRHARM